MLFFYKVISAEAKEKNETKICENCGKEFSCGAKSEECWCFDIELKAGTLAELRENFKNCLCKNCLRNTSQELHQ